MLKRHLITSVHMAFLLWLVASFAHAAPYVDEVLSDSPLIYQRFEETSGTTAANIGSLGASHNGTYGGGFTLGQTGAITGDAMNGAVLLDGSDGHVLLNNAVNSSVFSDGSYSVELWFKQPTAGQPQDLFAGTDASTGNHGILLETRAGEALRFLQRSPSGLSGGDQINPSGLTYTEDQWHHLVAVVDSGTMNLYLDGVLDPNSGVSADPAINFDLDMVLGRLQPGNSARSFAGLLDEFAVFDQALSQERVQAHFNNAATIVPEPSGLALWSIVALVGSAVLGWRSYRRRA